MGGNDIVDNRDGSFRTTENATERFSPLDLYLMGLLPPEAVPDFYYVDGASVPAAADPAPGVTFTGRRVDVSVDDVIAAEGPRSPASGRDVLTAAFVVVTRAGETADPAVVAKVNRYRQRWAELLEDATDGRARAGTALRFRGRL